MSKCQIRNNRTITILSAAIGLMLTTSARGAEGYAPMVDPSDFSTDITNPWFKMPVGKKIYYEAKTGDGLETTRIEITGRTRILMGVETTEYWDRVYLDGELIEETHDWIAQNRNGDVWYFGEDVDNYEDGQLKDHHGSWLAGENGALPGIWMKANPQIGDTYREEYLKGEAEDMAKVVSLSETVESTLGTFKNCIKTENWTPLEPDVLEAKFYCKEVGSTAREENVTDGESDNLVKVENGG